MFKPIALMVFALALSSAHGAEKTRAISSCTGVVSQVPITLDFLAEVNSAGLDTGNGSVVQTLGTFKVTSTAKVSITGDVTTVQMFTVTSPDIEFATITLPKGAKKPVQIFAKNFNAVWGDFTCTTP